MSDRAQPPAAPTSATQAKPPMDRGWLVSPCFDLLFLANFSWILIWLLSLPSDTAIEPVRFWQVYFLTTAHRWLTLVVVAIDPDRRGEQSRPLAALAVLAAIVVGGVYFGFGHFSCLPLVDLVWNGWHFAAQHAGILRMYSRKVGGGSAWLERYGLRLFVFYTTLRVAGWSTGWIQADTNGQMILRAIDMLVLALPSMLLLVQFRAWQANQWGKLAYLSSVCLLYAAILLSLHPAYGYGSYTIPLLLCSALFHATEYLAVLTVYAGRRRQSGSAGMFQKMAERWLPMLVGYVLLIGLLGSWLEGPLGTVWVGLNLWAAFLHYAYDGMIWKLRRPETARSLGLPESLSPRSDTA